MRVAILSDMHGNCLAFDAVLAELRTDPPDRVVCLGDAIQGGAQPAETVARLRDLGCPVVMGNADAWLLSGEVTGPGETVSDVQQQIRQWSLAQLSAADRQFIAGFQPTVEIALDGARRLLCFHGSPRSFDEVILPETTEEAFAAMLGASGGTVLTGGHTHLQQIRRLGDGFFCNPGSIGRAFDRHQRDTGFRFDPWAEYALLSSGEGRLRLEFRRVAFDVDRLLRIVHMSGRPDAETVIAEYGAR